VELLVGFIKSCWCLGLFNSSVLALSGVVFLQWCGNFG